MQQNTHIAITSANSLVSQQLITLLVHKGYEITALTKKEFNSAATTNNTDWINNPQSGTV